jgi:hypothetical protein
VIIRPVASVTKSLLSLLISDRVVGATTFHGREWDVKNVLHDTQNAVHNKDTNEAGLFEI